MTATTHATRHEPKSVALAACGKINLTLEVLGRRSDGYHDIRSLAIGVDLRDDVRVSHTKDNAVSIACDAGELSNPANLAFQAATLMASRFGIASGLHIEISKRIPIGAGLGGGSGDAAATIQLCNDLYELGLSPTELATIGADIGSDVPLFFYLPCAAISGRGEIVEALKLRWRGWVLLVHVQQIVSTADVYRSWRPSDAGRFPRADLAGIQTVANADELNVLMINHLEPAVFRVAPEVGRIQSELDRIGLGPLRVTGAGSVLYKLFDEQAAAREAADRLNREELGVKTMVVAAPVAFTTSRT